MQFLINNLTFDFSLFIEVFKKELFVFPLAVIFLNLQWWGYFFKALWSLLMANIFGVCSNFAFCIVSTSKFLIGKTDDKELKANIVKVKDKYLKKIKFTHCFTMRPEELGQLAYWGPGSLTLSFRDALYSFFILLKFHFSPDILLSIIKQMLST